MSDKLDVKFDMRKMTARTFQDFVEGAKNSDFERVSGVLAKIVKECPAEWGAPDDPQTYMNLPMFDEYKRLLQLVNDEAAAKN